MPAFSILDSGDYLTNGRVSPTGGTDADAVTLGDIAKQSKQLDVPAGAEVTFQDGVYTVAKDHPRKIVSRSIATPPGSPATGDAYIVPAGSEGSWGFAVGTMVQWSGTAWLTIGPVQGAPIWVIDTRLYITYDTGEWVQTSVPNDQGLSGDSLAAGHGADDSHVISQVTGLQAAIDAAGAPQATDLEITTGTETAARTISPAQAKLAVETHGPAVPVQSVAGRTGDVTLTLADAADSAASTGRLAITTAESDLLRDFPQATFAGRPAGVGSGALTEVTPSEALAILPLATSGSAGLMPAADKALIDTIDVINETLLGTFSTGNSTITLTDAQANVKNPMLAASAIIGADLRGVSKVRVRGIVGTAGASTMRLALKFSVGLSSYSWIMSNGDAAPADNSAAPTGTEETDWDAWAISTGGSVGFVKDVDVPTACKEAAGDSSIHVIYWGGDGVADPSITNFRVYSLGGASAASGGGVPAATDGEITTGTETATRTISPAQAKLAAETHAPAQPAAASDGEVTTGTSTSLRQFTPAQLKLAAETHAPSATDLSMTGDANTVTVVSSTGDDAVLTAATTSAAGVMTAAHATALADATARLAFTTYNGIVDTTAQTLSYTVGTRTFEVTRVGDYDVWANGTKVSVTTTKTVVHANATGTYYIYFNSSGNLIASTTKWSYFGNNAPVAVVQFNVNGPLGIWVDCRFPYRKSFYEWELTDRQIGAWLDTGYGMTFGATDGSISVAAGRHVLNGYGYSLSSPATTVAILRRRADLTWAQNSAASADMRLLVGGISGWDNAGTQTPTTTNYFVNMFLIIAGNTVYAVAGQAQYANQVDAEAATIDGTQIPDLLKITGRPLARVTYQRTTAVQAGAFVSWSDLRRNRVVDGVTLGGGGGAVSSQDPGGDTGYTTFALDIFIAGKPAAGDVVYRKAMNQRCQLLASTAGHAASARVGATTGGTFTVTQETWTGTDYAPSNVGEVIFASGAGNKRGSVTTGAPIFEAADSLQITSPSPADATLEDISISLMFALV